MIRGEIYYYSVTQGGAALALGYYLSPLRGFRFGALRSQVAERPDDLLGVGASDFRRLFSASSTTAMGHPGVLAAISPVL